MTTVVTKPRWRSDDTVIQKKTRSETKRIKDNEKR